MKIKTKNKIKIKSKCPKKQGKAAPEIFPITQEEKEQLGILAIKLHTIDKCFNLHTFLLRRKKLRGRFPPADKVIAICNSLLARRMNFHKHGLWAYLTTAVNKEESMSFAERNIKEGKDWKGMQPIGSLINEDLLRQGEK